MEISPGSVFRGDRWSRVFTGRRVVVCLRISSDPEDSKRGVTRQAVDAEDVVRSGGGVLVWTAVENDTSAFKKRRVKVSAGGGGHRWAWRVIRPQWEQALRMIRAGEADALLVVDLDRLTRDPRDLEDAVELVEHYRALVVDVSGALDLSTDHGIFLARMMVAHANLSSRDTSRRIRRAKRAEPSLQPIRLRRHPPPAALIYHRTTLEDQAPLPAPSRCERRADQPSRPGLPPKVVECGRSGALLATGLDDMLGRSMGR